MARRFRGAWRRHDRAARRRRFWRRTQQLFLAATGVAAFIAWVLHASPWPATVTLRHYAALINCASARIARLAPAMAGQPGN